MFVGCTLLRRIPVFCRLVGGNELPSFENCALPGYYASCNGNYWPTFRDTLSVPSLKLKEGIHQYTPLNSPEERSCHLLRGGSLKKRISKAFEVMTWTCNRDSMYYALRRQRVSNLMRCDGWFTRRLHAAGPRLPQLFFWRWGWCRARSVGGMRLWGTQAVSVSPWCSVGTKREGNQKPRGTSSVPFTAPSSRKCQWVK